MKNKTNYKSSGVHVDKADSLVSWIQKNNPHSLSSLGNDYASLLEFPFSKYKNPIIASCTDGIGTKIKLASYFSQWEGVAQDLVAMCVNDLICTGAKPYYFLDYYACGQLDEKAAKSFLKGLLKACKKASCKLVGGETAELPGLYKKGDVDCAGFAIGLVEKSQILGASKVRAGDEVIAIKSSGFHSNGYSLLRKLYNTPHKLKKHQKTLMKPTRLYTDLAPYLGKIKGLKAMAHITGGGLNNLSRILPENLKIQLTAWDVPTCFKEVQMEAQLPWPQLLKTFNCGLGLVLILSKKQEFLKHKLVAQKDIISLGKVSKKTLSQEPAWQIDYKSLKQKNS